MTMRRYPMIIGLPHAVHAGCCQFYDKPVMSLPVRETATCNMSTSWW